MTPQRRFIKALDRPGLQPVLAFLATRYARRKTGLDVQIFHDAGWIRRVGDYYLAESTTFDWQAGQIAAWRDDLGDILDMHRDWWFYQYKPKEGDVVLDVGAGGGEATLLFSKSVGRRGRVLSVEAHPTTFQLLQKTCRYNQLDQNTTCLQRAVMDKAGNISIDKRAHQGSTVRLSENHDPSLLHIAASSLDELCADQSISQVDFLKMNIEGAERFAIQGMPRMIERTRALCIACHDFIGARDDFYRTKALVIDYLRNHNFEVVTREQRPEPWARDHVYGIRRP